MRIGLQNFGGLQPRTEPRLLGDNQAQVATNCDLRRGNLIPLKAVTKVADLADALQISIFPSPDAVGSWLSWTTDVDVVRSPLASDQYTRLFYTGNGAPKFSAIPAPGGVRTAYPMGITAPTATPTVVAQNKGIAAVAAKITREWYFSWIALYPNMGSSNDTWFAKTNTQLIAEGAMPASDTLILSSDPVVVEVTPGKRYKLSRLPDPPAGLAIDSSRLLPILELKGKNPTTGFYYGVVSPPIGSLNESGVTMNYNNIIARCVQSSEASVATAGWTIPAGVDWARVGAIRQQRLVCDLYYDDSSLLGYTTDRSYVYTFVDSYGNESAPSDPSTVQGIDVMQDALLSGLATTAPTDTAVTLKNIYRTVITDSGTQYQYVGQTALANTTFTDTLEDSETGEVLASTNYDEPPTDMAGLIFHPAGFMAGFSGRTLCFSDIFQFQSWPADYQLTLDYDIVALALSENSIVALTKGDIYIVSGSSPDAMTPAKMDARQACVSKRGVSHIGNMVIFPSPDGLIGYQGGQVKILTEQFYTRTQWQALTPTSMIASVHDNQYIGFMTGATIIFSMTDQGSTLTTVEQTCTGLYSDLLTDTLYLIVGAAIYSWDTSATYRTATWRSRDMQFSRPFSFGVARIVANSYPQTLKLYANESLVSTLSLTTNVARRIPRLRNEKQWSFEIVATDEIYEVVLAESMGEL